MKKYTENRIRLDPDVNRSLDYYITEKNVELPHDAPGRRIVRNTVVSDVMKEFLTTVGHYPPKDEVNDDA